MSILHSLLTSVDFWKSRELKHEEIANLLFMDSLKTIRLSLLKDYPGLHKIHVNLITGTKQMTLMLYDSNTLIQLK